MLSYLSIVLDENGSIKKDLKALPLIEMDDFTTKFKDSEAIRALFKDDIDEFLNKHQAYINKSSRLNRGRICLMIYNDRNQYGKEAQLVQFLPVFYQEDKIYANQKRQKAMIVNTLMDDKEFAKKFLSFDYFLAPKVYNKIKYGLQRGYTSTFCENMIRDGLACLDKNSENYLTYRKFCWEIKKHREEKAKKTRQEIKEIGKIEASLDQERLIADHAQEEHGRNTAGWYRDKDLLGVPLAFEEGQIKVSEEYIKKIPL